MPRMSVPSLVTWKRLAALLSCLQATPGNTSPKRSSSIRSRTSRPKSVEGPRRGCNSAPAGRVFAHVQDGKNREMSQLLPCLGGRLTINRLISGDGFELARDQLNVRRSLESRVHQPAVATRSCRAKCGGRQRHAYTRFELGRNHGGFLLRRQFCSCAVGCSGCATGFVLFRLVPDGAFCPQDANPALSSECVAISLTSVCQLPDLAVLILFALWSASRAPDRPSGPVPLPDAG